MPPVPVPPEPPCPPVPLPPLPTAPPPPLPPCPPDAVPPAPASPPAPPPDPPPCPPALLPPVPPSLVPLPEPQAFVSPTANPTRAVTQYRRMTPPRQQPAGHRPLHARSQGFQAAESSEPRQADQMIRPSIENLRPTRPGTNRLGGGQSSCQICTGGACCAFGEWRDTSGARPICRCGDGSGFTGSDMCGAPTSTPRTAPAGPPRDTSHLRTPPPASRYTPEDDARMSRKYERHVPRLCLRPRSNSRFVFHNSAPRRRGNMIPQRTSWM